MGLKTRMAIAIALLFGLLFAVFMGVSAYFIYTGAIIGIWIILIPLGIAIGVILLQWGLSPYIIKWIYKINWLNLEQLAPDIKEFIRWTCQEQNINLPRFGIVPDNNPNAFCFGWTRNKSFLVITQGIFTYCDKEEMRAVIGHELGHIAHNDFVVMTIIAAIPLIFYVVFRGAILFARGGRRGNAAAAALVAAGVAFLVYILSQFIVLLVSRYREYWADEFSAKTTRDPNKLSSALVKIAYGLAWEGRGTEADNKHHKYESALMVFNAKAARALACSASDGYGHVSIERIKHVMAWDLWNPWAKLLELNMTHPLPAKRINALDKIAADAGQRPFIGFDLQKDGQVTESFAKDLFVVLSPLLSIPLAILAAYLVLPYGLLTAVVAGSGVFLFSLGVLIILYLAFYRYPKPFKDQRIAPLLEDPKASPIRGRPVRLRGRIIGRGVPGLFFSEDLKLDDGTGLLLLDYHQVLRFIDLMVGIFATQETVGQEVVVEGWYRRKVMPYLEILRLHLPTRKRRVWTPFFKYFGAGFCVFLGVAIWVLIVLPLMF